MAQNFIRNTPANDGIHDNIEFNEFHNAEYWTALWTRRMRRAFVLNKIAPYFIVLGTFAAFIAVVYMEIAL